jgi:hypothetical protein
LVWRFRNYKHVSPDGLFGGIRLHQISARPAVLKTARSVRGIIVGEINFRGVPGKESV